MSAEKTAERVFIERAMSLVRDRLYPGVTDSAFMREWGDLLLAVSEPAAYLHSRGAKLPGRRYLAILWGVIDGIVRDGTAATSRYRPMYLRACIQRHMQIQGERYLDEAKGLEARPAGAVAAAIVRKMRVAPSDPQAELLTAALVAARGLLEASRPARRKQS